MSQPSPQRRPRNNAEAWIQAAQRARRRSREEAAQRKQQGSASSPVALRSAGILAWGLVLLVVGGFFYANAYRLSLENALSQSAYSSDGSTAMLLGSIASVVGTILSIVGVYRLARNVDMLAASSRGSD